MHENVGIFTANDGSCLFSQRKFALAPCRLSDSGGTGPGPVRAVALRSDGWLPHGVHLCAKPDTFASPAVQASGTDQDALNVPDPVSMQSDLLLSRGQDFWRSGGSTASGSLPRVGYARSLPLGCHSVETLTEAVGRRVSAARGRDGWRTSGRIGDRFLDSTCVPQARRGFNHRLHRGVPREMR